MKKIGIKSKIKDTLFLYRYDIFSLSIMTVLIVLILNPIFTSGHIVFSDLDFGFSSKGYLGEIFGIWNERWSTSTLLNLARLIYILPSYLISALFNYSGPIFIKSFIFILIFNSAFSMYILSKRLISVYFSKEYDFFKIFALLSGSLFYALNPWVIIRIQHIYLLCGYSLFPLVLTFFFNAFDPKFQKQIIPNYKVDSTKLYKRNILDLFLLSLILTISSGAIHYFFYGAIFLTTLGLLVLIKTLIQNKTKKKIIIICFLKKLLMFSLFFILMSSYWLSSYIGSILLKAQASQHNINVIDTLSLFSRYSSIKNVLYLISYWWPMFNISNLPLSFYLGGGIILAFIFYTVIFKAYKHNILLFFLLLSIIFLIVATGVSLNFFAPIFEIIVTKTPVIGAIFRDPNKLVGLMAIGFSIFLTFGVESFYSKLNNTIYHNLIKFLTLCVVIISFIFYLLPFYNHFINGFYKPVPIPNEYLDIQSYLTDKEDFNSKVLYLPIADNMTRSNTGVATPTWNINGDKDGIEKATGDIAIYSSSKNTIFHHEGNIPSISYYINFLQYLMDKGYSSNIGKLISAFGVNELAYHNEYLDKEERQSFNEKILGIQKDLVKTYSNDIFTLYDVLDKVPYLYSVPSKIYTPNGFSKMESFSNIPSFNFNDFGVIFSTLEGNNFIDKTNVGDYIETNSFNDLFLSSLPKDNYLKPFDSINDGNAFLKWSKTYLSNNDWLWYLSSQDIQNFPFDFDFGAGVALTFATSKLNLLPYEVNKAKGKLLFDFDSLLRTEKFFKPDNPQFFNVGANPKSNTNNIPTLVGEIVRGEPDNIWQVAKSGIIEAKADNPYKFNIVVSGRGTNKVHVKVRFFDKDMKELGVSYVVGPREEVNFDTVNFTGEYVSPANSKFMRMDILTLQRPEQKTYWWIHDINIFDMEEYKAPNTFSINKTYDRETISKLYIRTLISNKGGKLLLNVGGKDIYVNTYDSQKNKFEWVDLGDVIFNKGDNIITIDNKSGFNAVNILALVPLSDIDKLSFPVKSAIKKGNLFSMLEGENDFSYKGNIQSSRSYPSLSLGRGISLQNGYMETTTEILKTDTYTFALKINGFNKNEGNIKLNIQNIETGEKIIKEISSNMFRDKGVKEGIAIDKDLNKDYFPQVFMKLPESLNYYKTLVINDINLIKGNYKITLEFKSNVPTLSSFSDIHKFNPSEMVIPEFTKDIFQEDCSDCQTVTFDMMRDRLIGDIFHIDYDKTCSCDWYDYASKQIPVNVNDEYLFNIDIKSEGINKRHMKVVFLDKDLNLVDVTYIDDVEEYKKKEWNSYQQIFKAPINSKYMQIHLLARGSKEEGGYAELKNYSVISYKEMFLLDNLGIFEGNSYENFLNSTSTNNVTYSRKDSMERDFKLDNKENKRVLLNYIESPNPLWEVKIGQYKERGTMILNGVTTGIITEETGEGKIEIILKNIYYLSFPLMFLSIILLIILLKRK